MDASAVAANDWWGKKIMGRPPTWTVTHYSGVGAYYRRLLVTSPVEDNLYCLIWEQCSIIVSMYLPPFY